MQTLLNNIVFLDKQLNAWFLSLHNAAADKIFLSVTLFGEAMFVIILAVIISALLWRWRKKWQIFALWVVVVGSGVCIQIAKLFFHRARPSGALIVENSASFPSGHATIAIAFYGFLAYLVLRQINQAHFLQKMCLIKKYRALILEVSIIIILVIGFSRLYLGVHYLSDVLAGYLVGAVWLAIGIKIDKLKSNNNKL